jgi:hypothetical protein
MFLVQFTPTMAVLKVIDRRPGRATCVLKDIFACFLTEGSLIDY